MKNLSVMLLSPLLLVTILFGSESGSITGTVVDERGTPVTGAKVNAVEAHTAYVGAVRYFGTDQQGSFTIPNLPFGEYRVFAQKREAGYPDMGLAFYSNHVFPVAVLSQRNPTAFVVVQLSLKAGIVKGRSRMR